MLWRGKGTATGLECIGFGLLNLSYAIWTWSDDLCSDDEFCMPALVYTQKVRYVYRVFGLKQGRTIPDCLSRKDDKPS